MKSSKIILVLYCCYCALWLFSFAGGIGTNGDILTSEKLVLLKATGNTRLLLEWIIYVYGLFLYFSFIIKRKNDFVIKDFCIIYVKMIIIACVFVIFNYMFLQRRDGYANFFEPIIGLIFIGVPFGLIFLLKKIQK